MRLNLAADSLSLLTLGPHEFVIQLETQSKAELGPELAAEAFPRLATVRAGFERSSNRFSDARLVFVREAITVLVTCSCSRPLMQLDGIHALEGQHFPLG
jgi:hypothetical protein